MSSHTSEGFGEACLWNRILDITDLLTQKGMPARRAESHPLCMYVDIKGRAFSLQITNAVLTISNGNYVKWRTHLYRTLQLHRSPQIEMPKKSYANLLYWDGDQQTRLWNAVTVFCTSERLIQSTIFQVSNPSGPFLLDSLSTMFQSGDEELVPTPRVD